MTVLRALNTLWSQRVSGPSRSLVDPRLVERRRHHHVPTTWIDPSRAGTAAIVHLHGGGYLRGAAAHDWEWLEDVRRRTPAAAAMVHYRMPPRHPFPVPYDDALQAVLSLTRNIVVHPGNWVLSGDGAGAGLALAVATSLREFGGAQPALLLLTTPWLDLSTGRPLPEELREGAELYADGADRDDPRLNPLAGDLAGLPPIHLTTGGRDPLLTDATRLVQGVRTAGGTVEVHEEPEGTHGYPLRDRGAAAHRARRAQITAVRTALDVKEPLIGA